MKKVEIISQRRLADAFFKLDEAELRHEQRDGSMSAPMRRLNLERGDGVAALVYHPQRETLIFVRQFRYPTYLRGGSGWLVELPAGMLDHGEEPVDCMRREILEETGYTVQHIEPISTFYLSPGGSSERIFLYYAEIDPLKEPDSGGGLAHEQEDIELVECSLSEVWRQLDAGAFVDAKTLIALQWMRALRAPS
jgi:nudix-type nucleoside diphosphatase (YffH/AdpP family)